MKHHPSNSTRQIIPLSNVSMKRMGAENEEKYEDDDQYEGDGFDAQLDRDKDGGKSLVLVLFIGTSICLLNFLQLKKIDTTGFDKIKCIMLTLGS